MRTPSLRFTLSFETVGWPHYSMEFLPPFSRSLYPSARDSLSPLLYTFAWLKPYVGPRNSTRILLGNMKIPVGRQRKGCDRSNHGGRGCDEESTRYERVCDIREVAKRTSATWGTASEEEVQ